MSRARPRPARGRPTTPAADGDLSRVFAALGDGIRFRIVGRLVEEGPTSITGLTRRSGVTRQAITKHLAVLSGAGLVRGRRRGRERLWRLERRRFEDARRFLDRISREWDRALARLGDLVEGGDAPSRPGARR